LKLQLNPARSQVSTWPSTLFTSSSARLMPRARLRLIVAKSCPGFEVEGRRRGAEPIVLTVPVIEKERYFSVQLIDAYTFNFAYIGSRTTGDDGGGFLIAGPNWKGELPKGVKEVFRSETEFVVAAYRTQLFNPADLDNVKKVHAGYNAQPLSTFLGTAAPQPAPVVDFVKPLAPAEEKTSLQFFEILNFVLQFCPTNASETDLMARFAKIGVGAGKTFDASKLSPEMKAAIEQGMADAWVAFGGLEKQVAAGTVTSGDIFGTREYLKNNYLYRMAAAVLGIRTWASRAPNGSSISRMRGSRVRASATRCFMPPEKDRGYWSATWSRRTCCKNSIARLRRASLRMPIILSPYSTFFRAVSHRTRLTQNPARRA
jgi:hypothetical protein